MQPDKSGAPEALSTGKSLRHLVLFQFKLALDALRDFALSPLSIVVFILDAVRKPPLEESLYLKLMALGRRSDRVINLFDEYNETTDYTVDQTFESMEEAVKPHWQDVQRRHNRVSPSAGEDADST